MFTTITKTSLKTVVSALRAANVSLDSPVVLSVQEKHTVCQYAEKDLCLSWELDRSSTNHEPGHERVSLRLLSNAVNAKGSDVLIGVKDGKAYTKNDPSKKGKYRETPQPDGDVPGLLRLLPNGNTVATLALRNALRVSVFQAHGSHRDNLNGTAVKLYTDPGEPIKRPVACASDGFRLCYGNRNGERGDSLKKGSIFLPERVTCLLQILLTTCKSETVSLKQKTGVMKVLGQLTVSDVCFVRWQHKKVSLPDYGTATDKRILEDRTCLLPFSAFRDALNVIHPPKDSVYSLAWHIENKVLTMTGKLKDGCVKVSVPVATDANELPAPKVQHRFLQDFCETFQGVVTDDQAITVTFGEDATYDPIKLETGVYEYFVMPCRQ